MGKMLATNNLNLGIIDGIYLMLLFFCLLGYVLPLGVTYSTVVTFVLFFYTLFITPSLKFKYSSYQFWGIIVICFSIISSLWALRPILSYYAIFSFIKLFILTYSMYRYCYIRRNFIRLLNIFIFINILLIFFVLSYFGTGILGQERMGDSENGFNGNSIGMSLSFALYAMYLIFKLKKVNLFSRMICCFLGILFFTFLLFTGSRTALLMTALPLVIYMFFKSKYKIWALVVITVLTMVMYYIVMEIPQFYNVLGVRIAEAIDIVSGNTEGGDSSRFLLFLYGVEWFQEHPILGIGINNYRVLSNVTPPFVGKNFYAHSNIIEMLVDVGIVGFLIYYSFIVILLKRAISNFSNNISKLVLSLTITIFIHDIISMSYYEWEMHFLICITFILQSFAEKEKYLKREKT